MCLACRHGGWPAHRVGQAAPGSHHSFGQQFQCRGLIFPKLDVIQLYQVYIEFVDATGLPGLARWLVRSEAAKHLRSRGTAFMLTV